MLNFAPYQGQSPLSEKLFEASPLNRVLKQSAPGASWAMGSGREIKFDYQTNSANEVIRLNALATWNAGTQLYDIAFQDLGHYAAGELYKNIVKDENWTSGNEHTTQEFKDKEGRVVLKRTFGVSDVGYTPSMETHDTYYVYDQFGNLTYVVPPLANPTSPNLDGLCYQNKYDHRNRLVEKKLPGKQWEFIVYDKLDRPVATGPAFDAFGDGNVGWLVTKYDAFGRVAYTGWYNGEAATAAGRKNMQEARNNQTKNFWEIQNTNSTIRDVTVGYTNTAFPTADFIVLSANYYDRYNFPGAPTAFANVEGEPVHYNNTQQPKGMPTGSWTRVLTSPSEYLGETSYILYDKKGRAIRTHRSNYLGGYTTTDNKLDFMGKALYTVHRHKRNASATELYTKDMFTYTPQDRLDTQTHQIRINGFVQLISKNEYDAMGQLVRKSVGGTDATGQTALQKVDYSYNIRGWLKEINKLDNLLQGTDPADLFAFKVNYDSKEIANANVSELYNGNIAETFWKTNSDNNLRSYGYQYDALNRLDKAFYSKNNVITNAYNEDVSYDKNGNITKLKRTGNMDSSTGMQIDDLFYFYTSSTPNQLEGVNDSTMHPEGFKGAGGVHQMEYDDNGNMRNDRNKDIERISYNHLNLPVAITFGNGNTISYLYDAAGVKTKKTVTTQGVAVTNDYLDGYHYEDGQMRFFPTAEGYVRLVYAKIVRFVYMFNYVDHLGNIRVSYSVDPSDNVLKITEENHYYPFGLKHKNYNVTKLKHEYVDESLFLQETAATGYNYKYNGMEYQDELGLNFYDYGARNYDPAIGRWMNIDPLAEQGRRWSPYNYAMDNPVFFLDPDGMLSESFMEKIKNSTNGTIWTNNDNGTFSSNGGETIWSDEDEPTQNEQDPPMFDLVDWFKSLFKMAENAKEAEQINKNRELFFELGDMAVKGSIEGNLMMLDVMTIPFGLGKFQAGKGVYRVVRESSTKYSVISKSGSATSFFKTLNPDWNGLFQYTKGAFSTTSFTTSTGIKVVLNTTSESTGKASVKIISKDLQILFRFPKI